MKRFKKTDKCPDYWDIQALNEDYNKGRITAVITIEENPEWFEEIQTHNG